MSQSIGWIGLGRTGEAMVKKLLQAGHTVQVWNRTRSKAEPLVAYGARVVDSKLDLAACDTVFTMLPTTNDLKEVLFGAGGVMVGEKKPKTVIDGSPISPDGSAEIRTRLEAMGVAYLCAAVSANAKVAKAAKPLLVASGPRALYDTNQNYLAAMSHKAMWVGEGELARVWRIAHNTMFGVITQSLCEITVLAEKAGIARQVSLESINDSALDSMNTRCKTPVLTRFNFEQDPFAPKLLQKGMDLGLGAARANRVPSPSAAATRRSPARMVGRGHDDIDFAVLLREIAACAGLKIEPLNVVVSERLLG